MDVLAGLLGVVGRAEVALDDLDLVVPRDALELGGGADQDPDGKSLCEEAWDEAAADVSGRARHEDEGG